MKIYCATTNAGKLRELPKSQDIRIEPLPGLAHIVPCEETGETFEENAVLKALYYGAHTDDYLIAEDSGIEVAALGGAPGVLSARFAGATATDAGNNRLLLERLGARLDRKARYVSAIALTRGQAIEAIFRGEVEGEIALQPRGTNGFGYDPLFYYPPFGLTVGEADPDRKQSVSHRGRALEKLFGYLLSR